MEEKTLDPLGEEFHDFLLKRKKNWIKKSGARIRL
jgi:hypothetical protein